MKTIQLSNDYHNTTTTIDLSRPLTLRRVKAIKSRLCGVDGCTCSTILGTRGVQRDAYVHDDLVYRAEGLVLGTIG